MEASKAEEIATSPDELQDLQDDLVIHQQTEPEPEPELEDELTNDIEKDPPKQPRAKRPRTKKQQPVPKALYDLEEEDTDEKLAILQRTVLSEPLFLQHYWSARLENRKNLAQSRGEPGRYTRGTRVEIGKKSAKE